MPVLMPSPVFRWFVPAQNGTGLVPAAGYIAAFYAAGTADEKTIYMPDGTVYPDPSNEAVLNSEGYAEIWLGPGSYKLRVLDPNRAEVYTLDNINGEGSFSTGFLPTVIATDGPATNGLAQYDTANQFVWCSGYYAIGDGGHGFFWNKTSTDSDDGGYVIASTQNPNKRWFRIPDESGDVRAASFGYIGDRSGNASNEMLAACAYCLANNKRLIIGPGDTAILGVNSSDFNLSAPFIHFEAGSMLTGTGSFGIFQIQGIASGTPEQHFTNAGYQLQKIQVNQNPEWSGASLGSSDNSGAFSTWLTSLPNGGTFILPPGTWNWIGNTDSFPYPTNPFILYGTINGTSGADIPPGEWWPDASQIRVDKVLLKNGQYLISSPSQAVMVGDMLVSGPTGNLTAQNVLGTNAVTSNKNVIAKASGTKFAASGQIAAYSGMGVATSGTSETDLCSLVLPANTLEANGDKIRIVCAGSTITTNGGQNRRFRCLIGSVVICDLTITNNGSTPEFSRFSNWSVVIELARSDIGNIQSTATLMTDFLNDTFGASPPCGSYWQFDSLTLSSNQTIQFKGTAIASGSITQFKMTIDYFPAPL